MEYKVEYCKLKTKDRKDEGNTEYGGLSSDMELCEEQQQAVEAILGMKENEVSIILTGCAGSGKSTVVKHLLKTKPEDFIVCATTGKAAVLVGGQTVDSLFCIDRDNWRVRSIGNQSRKLMGCPEYIIIDEASMIGDNMSRLIYDAAINYRKKIVMVGDWAQASPVKDLWPFRSPLFKDAGVLRLRENHRQSEGDFFTALNYIRLGISDRNIAEYFAPRVVPGFDDNNVVFVTGLRKEARARNTVKLNEFAEEHKRKKVRFNIVLKDKRDSRLKSKYPLSESQKTNLKDSCNLANNIDLAIGCRVIITRNAEDGVYVNGDTGYLEKIGIFSAEDGVKHYPEDFEDDLDFTDDDVVSLNVRLDRTGTVSSINRTTVEVIKEGDSTKKDKKVDFELVGFPLDLGYALTIHKSQGMTIPSICVDLASIERFPLEGRHGLAYVALSRVRKVDDLILTNWSDYAIFSTELVRPMITGEVNDT